MKFSFGIKSLFVATFVIACVMAILVYQAYWLFTTLLCVLAINLLGAVTAVALTRFFGFPTDGGFRDPTIRAEQTSTESLD